MRSKSIQRIWSGPQGDALRPTDDWEMIRVHSTEGDKPELGRVNFVRLPTSIVRRLAGMGVSAALSGKNTAEEVRAVVSALEDGSFGRRVSVKFDPDTALAAIRKVLEREGVWRAELEGSFRLALESPKKRKEIMGRADVSAAYAALRGAPQKPLLEALGT